MPTKPTKKPPKKVTKPAKRKTELDSFLERMLKYDPKKDNRIKKRK